MIFSSNFLYSEFDLFGFLAHDTFELALELVLESSELYTDLGRLLLRLGLGLGVLDRRLPGKSISSGGSPYFVLHVELSLLMFCFNAGFDLKRRNYKQTER